MNDSGIFVVIALITRVVGPIYCAMKADALNRNTAIWGVFGFLFPIISMIWVSFLSKKTNWRKEF
jgi:hypothetical protein